MLNLDLIFKIFNLSYMERWNDKIRPMPFYEIDKQAHKIVIAFFLSSFEESKENFSYDSLIKATIFEILQRSVMTDIKPTIFSKICEDYKRYNELQGWIYKQLEEILFLISDNFAKEFKEYFRIENNSIIKKILSAAHIYSSKWEFDILKEVNPNGYDIDYINENFEKTMEQYYDLEGIKQLALYKAYRKFIDLCGQLRFQTRWANLYRIPKTSVLGHSLFVAIFSYILSLKANYCEKRRVNNFFCGLFHDLPEVLTRDIISPVKKSIEGLNELIKEYEKEQMEKIVYPLVPDNIKELLKFYTEEEFDSLVIVNGKKQYLNSEIITHKYNQDIYNPKDGELVKAVDELSAFIEAFVALENGSNTKEFNNAVKNLKEKYTKTNTKVGGIDFSEIYNLFLF